MGLLSFLKSKSGDAPKASPSADPADAVQQARTRARHRLIGAAVLVVAGVIGFPMLFATQPRPLPIDTPIELARRDGPAQAPAVRPATPPVAAPAPPQTAPADPDVVTETQADAGREVPPPAGEPEALPAPPPVASAPERKPAPKPPEKAASKPVDKPARAAVEAKPAERKPADKPAAKPADASRAQALLNGESGARADKPADGTGRFIVQVGAFGEMTAARDARQKVEKLGLKTYTQVVDTPAGSRIRVRVGPFASRADAEKAAAKIKSAGLGSAVFTL